MEFRAISSPKRWCCESAALNMPANLENSAVATGLEKDSFHSNPKERQCQKCSNYCTIVHISHASKVMLNILQARLQQYMNWELPDVPARFRKGRGTRDQIANIHWIIGKAKEFQIYFCFIDYAKVSVWITTNCRKFIKRWDYQTILPSSWEICMWVKKQQLELDMEQWTGSKLKKEYIKAVYCHPAYFTDMQITWCKVQDWMKNKLELVLPGEISITSDMQMTDTSLMAESKEELKSLLMKVKVESEKAGLKLNIQKTKIVASGPITLWQIEGGTIETVTDFLPLGSKITADGDCGHEIKRCLLLGRKAMTN